MRLSFPLALLICALLFPISLASARPAAQSVICFPDVPGISSCVAPEFSAYWSGNGGLPIFGYPLAPIEPFQPAGAVAPLSAQWTERNRLEAHPENPQPYQVQLGRMGAERLAQLGRAPLEPAEPGPQDGCRWFPETGHNVCDQAPGLGFRSYWEGNGLLIGGLGAYERSLALFGLPLTAAQPEPSASGELILTQWFERARFEWHPENPERSRVLLGLLGRELREAGAAPGAAVASEDLFSVEINRGFVASVAGRIGELGVSRVRYNGILWSEVEARQGERNWPALAGVEAEIAAISAAGAAPMVIVRGTPEWARQVRSSGCGPIKADAIDEFAAFMGELAARYSQPPYNVRYWELGNEPDADVRLVGGDAPYGCWGDARQPYHNGAAYAAMLKAAYPAIKAANPEAQVIFGGLLLECDPTQGRPCNSGSFLEGVLQAGAGESFDILAYHSYPYWRVERLDWDNINTPWEPRGGMIFGKLQFMREVMARYGLSKPIMMNEGGLLCYRSSPTCEPGGFSQDQANYLVRLYARGLAYSLDTVTWFTLNGPGFQESGLLDRAQRPRPAFQSYKFMSGLLRGASYVGPLASGALEGHEFRRGDLSYRIYWTNDGSSVPLGAISGARAVYTIDGASSPAGEPLSAGFEPIIVELGPAGP